MHASRLGWLAKARVVAEVTSFPIQFMLYSRAASLLHVFDLIRSEKQNFILVGFHIGRFVITFAP